jgi:hypothetical protein
MELMPVFVAALFGFGIVEHLKARGKPPEPQAQNPYAQGRPIGFVSLVGVGLLTGVFLFIFPIRFIRQVWDHGFLTGLRAEDVKAITVGNRTFTSPREVDAIVQGLNRAEWFTSNHGGWASNVDLLILKRSGEEQYFQVALYLKEPGAVITFVRARGRITWQDGYAFSRNLPAVLQGLDAPLPAGSRR